MKKYVILNRQDRIGHFFHDLTNFYANYEKNMVLVIIKPEKVANKQLYKMWLRNFDNHNIFYIELKTNISIFLFRVVKKFLNIFNFVYNDSLEELNAKKYYDVFKKSKNILGSTTFDGFENKLFNSYNFNLQFNEKELKDGEYFLKKLNIENNKFVLFHSRDGEYLSEKTNAHHECRNVDFASFKKSIELLDKENIKSLRFGVTKNKIIDNKLNEIESFFDYANKFRTDFLDIFLISKTRYFVGNTSGPYLITYFFNKANVITNQIPIDILLTNKKDIFLFKRLIDSATGKELSLEFILKNKIFYRDSLEYIKNKIQIVDNSEEEIYEACKEMELQLSGKEVYTHLEDLDLLKEFLSLMNEYLPNLLILGKPSLYFLKNYKLRESD